jgi:hypothetical protein
MLPLHLTDSNCDELTRLAIRFIGIFTGDNVASAASD